MNFKVGDRVKYNSQLLAFTQPEWANSIWTITALQWDAKQGQERLFARLAADDGLIHNQISTTMLVQGA
jgi:hypothetical protein